MWKWIGLFLRKNHLLRCSGWPSLLNWFEVLTLSLLLKVPPRKVEPWFILWSFFLLRLLKSTKRPCIEYCCHVWADVPSCHMKLLDKLQKRKSRTVGSYLAGSFEPLAHRRSVASLRLFCKYYFGWCSSGLAQLVSLNYSRGRSTRYSDILHGFSVTIQLDVKRMSMSTVSFIAQLDSGIHCL